MGHPAPAGEGLGSTRWLLALTLVVATVIVVLLQLPRYGGIVCDDAFISLRYARRLLDGAGLTWNDGERVEGYSNLLWILGAAGLGRLGLDLLHAAWVLGGLGTLLAILSTCWISIRQPGGIVGLLVALLALAMSKPVVAWTVSGLEAPLFLGLLGLTVACLLHFVQQDQRKRWLRASALGLGLLCVTRPDGPLFVAVCAGSLLLMIEPRRRALVAAIELAGIAALFVLAQLAFRLDYYGEWIPNTALVKLGTAENAIGKGLEYVIEGLAHQRSIWLLSLLAIPACLTGPRTRRARILMMVALMLTWAGYVVSIGGDHFRARRQLLPIILVLAWLAGEGSAWLWVTARRAVVRIPLAICVLAMLGVYFPMDQLEDKQVLQAYHDPFRNWERGLDMSCALEEAFGETTTPLLAVEAAGVYPYYTQWPTVDMLGLNDHWIPRNPPARPHYTHLVGHGLGSGAYVMRRSPDVIVFNIGYGSHMGEGQTGWELVYGGSGSPEELAVQQAFLEGYAYQEFRWAHRGTRLRAWVKRHGGATGIQRQDSLVRIPAYLMVGDLQNMPLVDDGLLLPLEAGEVAEITLELGPGRWESRFEQRGGATFTCEIEEQSDPFLSHTGCVFELSLPGLVSLRVTADEPTLLEACWMVRPEFGE